MNCKDALKILFIETNQRSLSDSAAAKQHLLSCPKCRAFFDEEEKIKTLLRDKVPKRKAPARLREKIFRKIEERSSTAIFLGSFHSKRRKTFALAISLVLILFLVLFLYTGGNNESHQIVNEITEHHIEYVNSSNLVDISSSSPNEVESWFRDKVDFMVNVPGLSGTNLVGGRLCSIFGQPAAVLVYKNRSELLSLFILDKPNFDISSMDMVDIDGNKLCRGNGKGFNMVLWKDRGLVYALVSPMKEMELLRLASTSIR